MSYRIVKIASASISGVGVIFNVSGLLALWKVQSRHSNQILIVKNLSIINIIVATFWLLRDVEEIGEFQFQQSFRQVIFAFHVGAYQTWLLMIYVLTIDRFYGTYFPFNYRINSSKYRVVIWVVWCLGLITSVSNCTHDMKVWRKIYERYVWLLLDFVYQCSLQ